MMRAVCELCAFGEFADEHLDCEQLFCDIFQVRSVGRDRIGAYRIRINHARRDSPLYKSPYLLT